MAVKHALLAALLLSEVCAAATVAEDARPHWVGNDECRINLSGSDYIDVDHRTFSVFREGEERPAAEAQVSESANAAIDAELTRLGWVKLYRSGAVQPEQGRCFYASPSAIAAVEFHVPTQGQEYAAVHVAGRGAFNAFGDTVDRLRKLTSPNAK